MNKLTSVLLFALLVATFSAAQENDGEPARPAATDEAAEPSEQQAGGEQETETDDADLDQQTYEEDDDVFVPTEEIPADEPIPFPTDI